MNGGVNQVQESREFDNIIDAINYLSGDCPSGEKQIYLRDNRGVYEHQFDFPEDAVIYLRDLANDLGISGKGKVIIIGLGHIPGKGISDLITHDKTGIAFPKEPENIQLNISEIESDINSGKRKSKRMKRWQRPY
jgi:hypothetical protein